MRRVCLQNEALARVLWQHGLGSTIAVAFESVDRWEGGNVSS